MKKNGLGLVVLLGFVFIGGYQVSAREIGEFSNFKVTYSGGERYTSSLVKAVTKRQGVVNLTNDNGSAWITATMINSIGEYRGSTDVQRGKRSTFDTPKAEANYKYRLGLKKTYNTGGGTVTIRGSWSPDSF